MCNVLDEGTLLFIRMGHFFVVCSFFLIHFIAIEDARAETGLDAAYTIVDFFSYVNNCSIVILCTCAFPYSLVYNMSSTCHPDHSFP